MASTQAVRSREDFGALLARIEAAPQAEAQVLLSALERQAKAMSPLSNQEAGTWFDERVHALVRLRSIEAPDVQVEILMLFTNWFMKDANWDACVELTDRAAALSRASGRLALLRRSLSARGAVLNKAGNLEEATICFVEALQIAEQLGDRTAWCMVQVNLADSRFNAGLLNEAIKLNEQVVDLLASDTTLLPICGIAHHNIAIAALTLDDVATASYHIERTARLLQFEPTTTFGLHQRLLMEVTYTRVLIAMERYDEARTHAQSATRYADRIGSRPAFIQAKLAESLCDLVRGHAAVALQSIAQLKAEAQGNEPLLRDLMEAQILAYRKSGNEDEAKRCQQEFLSHVAEWQVRSAERDIEALKEWMREGGRRRAVEEGGAESRRTSARGSGSRCLDRLESIAAIAELREDSSGEHALRLGRLCALLARRVGHDARHASVLERAARLHDLGKLSVPDAALLNRHKLNRVERDIVRRHVVEGARMIEEILECALASWRGRVDGAVDVLRSAARVARHHHEWWDGSGYPSGLAGESIPIEARIVAVCDLFDELVHGRIYREARSVAQALAEISSCARSQLDPALCREFAVLIGELRQEHGEELEGFGTQSDDVSPFIAANQVIARIVRSASKTPEATTSFTPAEREVLKWLKLGRSNREIAKILYKSEFTVKTHIQHMLSKTGLDNRVQLASLPVSATVER